MEDPKDERNTLIVNGVLDNRNWKEEQVEQYSELSANVTELLMRDGSSCLLTNVGLVPRFASTAFFVNDMVSETHAYRALQHLNNLFLGDFFHRRRYCKILHDLPHSIHVVYAKFLTVMNSTWHGKKA